MTPEKWRDLQSSIKLTIGNNNYRTWIDPLNFSHVEDDVAVFDVPTTFLGNYVEQNFGDVILYKLSEAQAQEFARTMYVRRRYVPIEIDGTIYELNNLRGASRVQASGGVRVVEP